VVKLFHKPYGILSQYRPVEGKRTLLEFPELRGGRAVGRLDQDSEGLLLISDENRLLHRLTTPGRVEKTYWALVEGIPDQDALDRLRQGPTLGDGPTRPARAQRLELPEPPPGGPAIRERRAIPTSWLEIIVREGRNRQVRRMTAAVGHPTLRLLRVAVGPLQLGALPAGQARWPHPDEQVWLEQL
jgi:23S rRNA pseudouridine2457 synthase